MAIEITRGGCNIRVENPDSDAYEMLAEQLRREYEKRHQEWLEELRVAIRKVEPGQSIVVETPFKTTVSLDAEPAKGQGGDG